MTAPRTHQAESGSAPRPAVDLDAVRRSPEAGRAVARIVRDWRRLTTRWGVEAGGRRRSGSGEPLLVGLSGGADSSALAIALAVVRAPATLAHIVHDLRSEAEAEADAARAALLAEQLALPYARDAIRVRAQPGNAEGNARRARYAALAELAKERGVAFIATAHHADDQLESVLMGLLRGASLRGLSGVAPVRGADEESSARGAAECAVRIIRPMLGVTRADAEAICAAAGWEWVRDRTNFDTSRLRSALRYEIVPLLRDLRPDVELRAARTADHLREAAELVGAAAADLDERARSGGANAGRGLVWRREDLRGAPALVVGELLRGGVARLRAGGGAAQSADDSDGGSDGTRGAGNDADVPSLDRLSGRTIESAVRAVRDRSGEAREFHWHAVRVLVRAQTVEMELVSRVSQRR